jgi:hypothetical protein
MPAAEGSASHAQPAVRRPASARFRPTRNGLTLVPVTSVFRTAQELDTS